MSRTWIGPAPAVEPSARRLTLPSGTGFSTQEGLRLSVAGLGDVGGTLVLALRLLAGARVARVGLFDLDARRVSRYVLECGQMRSAVGSDGPWPEVTGLDADNLFDADLFVFCVTAGVPPLGFDGDVRLYQFERNARLVADYAARAAESHFRGVFAVVSDPVDPLCAVASSVLVQRGWAGATVRGFGLGVMYARACWFAQQAGRPLESDGRVYGPHGDGLLVVDSLTNYDRARSAQLTAQTVRANLDVRDLGFKPFLAPAVSSAAYGLLGLISGEWHFSSLEMALPEGHERAFFGVYNRTTADGTEVELPALATAASDDVTACFARSAAAQRELLASLGTRHDG